MEDNTAGFYMDSSPKDFLDVPSIFNFVSREKPEAIDWSNFRLPITMPMVGDEVDVDVLRASMFFYEGQKIKFGKLKEYFSLKAIYLLHKDGYIKIKQLD